MSHPLVTALVDDAALLTAADPGRAEIARRARDAAGLAPVGSGLVVVPAAHVGLLDGIDDDVQIALAGPLVGPDDPTLVSLLENPRVTVRTIEVPWPGDDRALGALADLKDGRRRTPVLACLDVDADMRGRMSTLAILGAGVAADIAGLGADPVARLVGEVVLRGVPMAVTGIRTAVTTDAGIGALNLALAVQRLVDGWPMGDALTTTDVDRVRDEIVGASTDVQRAARSLLLALRSVDARDLCAQIGDVLPA